MCSTREQKSGFFSYENLLSFFLAAIQFEVARMQDG